MRNEKSEKQERETPNKRKEVVESSDQQASSTRVEARRAKKLFKTEWQEHQSAKKQSPHVGSYALEAMRERFGIELPVELLRQKRATDANATEGDETRSTSNETEAKRFKRKVAFLLGYLGTNFTGFQMNEDQRTLQAEFELALLRCKLLDARNFGSPSKYGWSTSGRTDKGVHACAQVCSAKIELLPDQTLDQVREALNRVLPPDFQVLDIVRTTKSFCAKTQRDRVRYQYMIPSFLLADSGLIRGLFERVGAPTNGRHPSDPLTPEEIATLKPQLKDIRVTPEQLSRLKDALRIYEGTHSFHNFTKGVKPDEARATRFVVSFNVEDPIVFENGVEWIPTQVLGQSFLLHQIRKMVCMAIEVGRGVAKAETIRRAFEKDDAIRVGLAPAQGLYLDMSFYDGYNLRKMHQNPELEDADWTPKNSPAYERWKRFRSECVMKHVVSEEEEESNFVKFLFLQEFFFDRDNYDPDKRVEHRQFSEQVMTV